MKFSPIWQQLVLVVISRERWRLGNGTTARVICTNNLGSDVGGLDGLANAAEKITCRKDFNRTVFRDLYGKPRKAGIPRGRRART